MTYARVHRPQESRSLPSFMTLSGARSALRSGKAWDPGTAQAEADRMDAAQRNELPLWGIPIGIKDIIDVAGTPTTANSRVLAGMVPQADAPVVARLRAAGAL